MDPMECSCRKAISSYAIYLRICAISVVDIERDLESTGGKKSVLPIHLVWGPNTFSTSVLL
jgi:hypothetical protein